MRTIPSSGCTLYTIIRGEMMSLTTWKWQVVSLIPWIARPWRGSKSPILRVRSSWTGEMKWEAFELRECNTGGGEEILNILPGWRSPWLFFNNIEGEWNTCRWSTGGLEVKRRESFHFCKNLIPINLWAVDWPRNRCTSFQPSWIGRRSFARKWKWKVSLVIRRNCLNV